jgi:hypothetical protein
MMGVRGLVRTWRERADQLRPYATAAAAAFESAAAELEAAVAEEEATALSLEEAAEESGYSPDHLGRLVREGRIPNAGKKNAPRILRRSLPRKPATLRDAAQDLKLVGATPGQIARAVVTPEGGPR